MTYEQLYAALCHHYQNNPPSGGYFEIHHIKPRHAGGGNEPSNLVKLSYRDHLLAHVLYAKWKKTSKAWSAVIAMGAGLKQRGQNVDIEEIEALKKAYHNEVVVSRAFIKRCGGFQAYHPLYTYAGTDPRFTVEAEICAVLAEENINQRSRDALTDILENIREGLAIAFCRCIDKPPRDGWKAYKNKRHTIDEETRIRRINPFNRCWFEESAPPSWE